MIDRADFGRQYAERLAETMMALPFEALGRALEILERAYTQRRRVFLIGNGGSAATASHMANDLMWGFAKDGLQGMRAIALTDSVPLLTAIANDLDYSRVFAVQLETLAEAGDVLVVVSGSGNSTNLCVAVETAKRIGLTIVAFLGKGGGLVAGMVDVAVIVPSDDYGPIEDLHMMFDHLAIAYLRKWAAAK